MLVRNPVRLRLSLISRPLARVQQGSGYSKFLDCSGGDVGMKIIYLVETLYDIYIYIVREIDLIFLFNEKYIY